MPSGLLRNINSRLFVLCLVTFTLVSCCTLRILFWFSYLIFVLFSEVSFYLHKFFCRLLKTRTLFYASLHERVGTFDCWEMTAYSRWNDVWNYWLDLNQSLKFGYDIRNAPSWLMKATRNFLHCKQLFSTAKSWAKRHLFQQLHVLNILPVIILEAWATQTELICSPPLALAACNLVRYIVVIHASEWRYVNVHRLAWLKFIFKKSKWMGQIPGGTLKVDENQAA